VQYLSHCATAVPLLLVNSPKFSHISLSSFRPAFQTFLSMMQNHESHWPCDSNNTHLHTYNDISHQVSLIILGFYNGSRDCNNLILCRDTWFQNSCFGMMLRWYHITGKTHISFQNLVNKTNSMHNFFLVYLSISTCFRRQCAHHQEKQVYLCDTRYLLFCMDDCVACSVE
jgi:hypothetical protein